MALRDVIDNLQAHALSLSVVNSAPTNPTETEPRFPFAISYPRTASNLMIQSAGWGKGIHTVWTELHFNRSILPVAVAQAIPVFEAFMRKLVGDPTLGGAGTITDIGYTFGRLEWGEVETIGWRIEIGVKIHTIVQDNPFTAGFSAGFKGRSE